MIKVYKYEGHCVNVTSTFDARRLERLGAIEVKDLSVFKGFEKEVSPLNTIVNDDGTITFNLDVEQQNNKSDLQSVQRDLNELNQSLEQLKEAYLSAVLCGNAEAQVRIKAQYQSILKGEEK